MISTTCPFCISMPRNHICFPIKAVGSMVMIFNLESFPATQICKFASSALIFQIHARHEKAAGKTADPLPVQPDIHTAGAVEK